MHASPGNADCRDLALALEGLPVGVAITGPGGRLAYANPHLCRVLGITAGELSGVHLARFRTGAAAHLRVEIRTALLAGDTWQGEVALQTRAGVRPVLESCYPLHAAAEGGRRAVHFFHELAVLRRADGLSRLAFHDRVTGLPSRGLLLECLTVALGAARRNRSGLAVVYADIEQLRGVNALLGCGAGDTLLRRIAERMRLSVRDSDTIARAGGDEFAIILPALAGADAASAALEKLEMATRGWYEAAGRQYPVTLSCGVSVYPRDGMNAETLLRRAEAAMHRAKARNRDASAAAPAVTGSRYMLEE